MTDVRPDGPQTDIAELAAEIRRRRWAAGLSQPQLAALVHYSRQYISMAEQPGNRLPSKALIRALDQALNTNGALTTLRHKAASSQHVQPDHDTARESQLRWMPTADRDHPQAVIPALRSVLAAPDLPADGPVRPIDMLEPVVAALVEQRLEARYGQMAMSLPSLLAELLRAWHTAKSSTRPQVAHLLTAAYRAADGLAFKFGYTDLSARLIDLMRTTASETDDPLLLASVAYVRTETFFATGDLDTALRALIQAADHLARNTAMDISGAAAYGSLHMRAAVVAARAGQSDRAGDHLAEAQLAATRVPEGVYYGTAFGPSSVVIHDVATAVEVGDSPTAIQRGASWHPPRQIPAERRSHYYIDLARAHLDVGRFDDAFDALRTARQIAPQHIRAHPQVHQALATLNRTPLGRNAQVSDYTTWMRLTPTR